MSYKLLIIALISFIKIARADSDIIFIDRLMMDNSINELNKNVVKSDNWIFFSEYKNIYYYAKLGVINPTKNQYNVEYICMNKKGKTITHGALKMNLHKTEIFNFGKKIIRESEFITTNLFPKINEIAKRQSASLENSSDYYMKLYVDKKLIAISHFQYKL